MRVLLPAMAALLAASALKPLAGSAMQSIPRFCGDSLACAAAPAGKMMLAAGHGGGMGGGNGGMGGAGGGMGGGAGGGMGGTGGGMGGTAGGMGGGMGGMGGGPDTGSTVGVGASSGSLTGTRRWYQCVTPFGRCSYAASGSPAKGDACYCASAQSPGRIQ